MLYRRPPLLEALSSVQRHLGVWGNITDEQASGSSPMQKNDRHRRAPVGSSKSKGTRHGHGVSSTNFTDAMTRLAQGATFFSEDKRFSFSNFSIAWPDLSQLMPRHISSIPT